MAGNHCVLQISSSQSNKVKGSQKRPEKASAKAAKPQNALARPRKNPQVAKAPVYQGGTGVSYGDRHDEFNVLVEGMAEYAQCVIDPVGTPSGLKMPTYLGYDGRSSSIKSSASYDIWSSADGSAACYLTGHPNGVFLSADGAGAERGLSYNPNPYLTGTPGWLVNVDESLSYSAVPEEIQGLFQASSAARIAAFGAEFKLSSAVLQQSGDTAIRSDYAKRFATFGNLGIGYPVFQPEDIINYTTASNGQEVVVHPATQGFKAFGVPVSGAEDWHSVRTVGYNDSAAGIPIVGYGLSATDAEQTMLLALFSNSVINHDEMELMLKSSWGAWSTIMIVWRGLPPNTMVGTLNVAMHYEVIPKSKGIDFAQRTETPHPDAMAIVRRAVQTTPKASFGDALRQGARILRFGGRVLQAVNPGIYGNVMQVANQMLGKLFGVAQPGRQKRQMLQ